MGLKRYIFGSIVLIGIVFGFVFSIEPGDYVVVVEQLKGQRFILPIALWAVLPALVLLVITILHISYYGFKNYLKAKSVSKDIESMMNLLSNKLSDKESVEIFKNKDFMELAQIINQLEINIGENQFSSTHKNIDKIISQLFRIQKGEFLSVKEFNLDNNNPYMIQNIKNRILTDENFALEAMKRGSKYSEEIVELAFNQILDTKPMTTIKKHLDEVNMNKNMLKTLLKKDSEQETEIAMNNDMILKLIKKIKLTNDDLIEIAQFYKLSMAPEQLIKLYEDISVMNEDYTSAYLYILAEYEMIDNMRDILLNSSATDYTAFKAIIDLKDAGKNIYSLDAICYK
jgi:hypothetical protein